MACLTRYKLYEVSMKNFDCCIDISWDPDDVYCLCDLSLYLDINTFTYYRLYFMYGVPVYIWPTAKANVDKYTSAVYISKVYYP